MITLNIYLFLNHYFTCNLSLLGSTQTLLSMITHPGRGGEGANIGDSWVWHDALFAASKLKGNIFVVFVNIVQVISEFLEKITSP
jgi:hypothetical protein